MSQALVSLVLPSYDEVKTHTRSRLPNSRLWWIDGGSSSPPGRTAAVVVALVPLLLLLAAIMSSPSSLPVPILCVDNETLFPEVLSFVRRPCDKWQTPRIHERSELHVASATPKTRTSHEGNGSEHRSFCKRHRHSLPPISMRAYMSRRYSQVKWMVVRTPRARGFWVNAAAGLE